jgi:AraC family transcriptional regulator, ethanolamine operon transcriptional activator
MIQGTVKPIDTMVQAAVTVAEISDPTVTNAGIELLDQDVVQLQATPLRVRRVVLRLVASVVVYYSTNLRVRTRTSVREGLLGYVTFGPQAKGTVNGLSVRPGLMLAAEPASEGTFVADAGWESVTFLIPERDIREHLTARQRESEFRVPHGVEIMQLDEGRVRELFDWGKRLAEMGARKPELFNDVREERVAAEADLLEMLLATLRVAGDLEPSRADRKQQTQSRIVKKAEAHALSNPDDRLYVTDLCRAAAVSERTLEYAFKQVLGLTPMTYLIRLRLHRVRQALRAATADSTTVSAEALNWGFWHFGQFSRAYKACFGESPSDTLRRKVAGPPG